jgi:hypothetical protein
VLTLTHTALLKRSTAVVIQTQRRGAFTTSGDAWSSGLERKTHELTDRSFDRERVCVWIGKPNEDLPVPVLQERFHLAA